MRHFLFALLLSFSIAGYAQAQPTSAKTAQLDSIPRIIEPISLQPYEGQKVTVVGRIVQVKFVPSAKNGPTFLNMHSVFPHTPFTLTIFERQKAKFPPLQETYEGKVLEVTGVVSGFESIDRATGKKNIRMGIIIESPDQIKVAE